MKMVLIIILDYDLVCWVLIFDLIKKIEKQTSRPLIALGGGGNWASFY